MSREEAINGLKVLRREFSGYKPNEEMFDIAIKALEQQLCEDAISRENVEECKELMTDTNEDLVYVVRMSDIRQLPSVTPQPKMGQWILTQRNKYVDICCSECGHIRIKDYAYGYTVDELDLDEVNDLITKIKMNYCEFCGTKMWEVEK